MIVLYLDTSALIRAYLPDEADHQPLSEMLFRGPSPVVTSELTRAEVASAVMAATRAGRLASHRALLDRLDADCADDGPITLLRIVPEFTIAGARDLALEHPLRTLDAIHLAVALEHRATLAQGDQLVFVTRDRRQGRTPQAKGLMLR